MPGATDVLLNDNEIYESGRVKIRWNRMGRFAGVYCDKRICQKRLRAQNV